MTTMEDTNQVTGAPQAPEPSIEGEVAMRAFGLQRWVHAVFFVMFALSFWLLDKIITLVWEIWAEPSEVVVTVASLGAAAAFALGLYKHEPTKRMADEVVGELSKVTWPSRKETSSSTVVVIITSLIAAAIIGGFDFIWSAITDLLYKYKV